jgi:hypothetical protein
MQDHPGTQRRFDPAFPASSLHRTMVVLTVAGALIAAWTGLVLGWSLFFGSY